MSKVNGGIGGTIINISSLSGIIPFVYAPVYAATKSFIYAYTKGMAHQFNVDKYGVKFIVICPGGTRTKIINDFGYPYPYSQFYYVPIFLYRMYLLYGTLNFQSPSVVGECVVTALRTNRNGSVWISNNSKNYEVNPKMIGKYWKEKPT